MCFSLAACDSCDKEDETPTALTTPTVTIDDKGVASWEAVENASKYAYKINDGTEVETSELSRQLSDGEKIAVKAVGDGKHYSDSSWSEVKTYKKPAPQPTTLGKPVVSIAEGGLASWTAVPNASGYKVKIGETETNQTGLTKQLDDGQSIQVKAVGNGTTYTDGDWSEVKTYTAKLPAPDVHGHVYGDWKDNNDGTHTGTCQVTEGSCGNPTKTESHTYDREDNTKCVCGAIKPNGGNEHTSHNWSKTYVNDGANGHYQTCDGCDERNPGSHEYDGDDGKTCTKCGYVRVIIPADALTAETTIEAYAKAQVPAWANGTKYSEVKLNDYITVSMTGGSNTSKYYDTRHDWRAYQNEAPEIKVEAKPGYEIIAVAFTYKASNTGILASKTDTTKTFDSEEVISGVTSFTVANTGTATNGNIQITAIKVVYKRVVLPLDAPEVNVDDYGVVTWAEVEGASGYAYKINDGETVTVAKDAELKYDKLTNGQKIKVWAVGSAENYLSDSAAVEKTYTQTQLVMSTVSVDEGGLATWNAVEGASGYEYILLDKDNTKVGEGELDKDTCFKQLGDGQKIQVMAVGEGLYISSAYTDPSDLYTVPEVKTPCGIPEIEIARDGKVTIKKVTGAGSYKYIVTNAEGEDQTEVSVDNLATLNLTLNPNEKIKAMAVGNGTSHTDGTYPETAVQYKAATKLEIAKPTVKPEGSAAGKVTVSFAEVEHATGYRYTIDSEDATTATLVTVTKNDGVASFVIDLEENKVIRVMAIGNENAEDYAPIKAGDYSNGYDSSDLSDPETFNIDNTKTYSVAEILPIIGYYGTTESTKSFTVTGVVVGNTNYYASSKSVNITLADNANEEDASKTVFLYAAKVPADFDNTTENLLTTVTTTVTATGKVKIQNGSRLSAPEVTIAISAENRFKLAVPILEAKKTDLGKDISEDITLPVSIFGATVTWSINETDATKLAAAKAAFVINNDTGNIEVYPAQEEITFTLVATLKVGETTYDDADKKLNYSVTIPADTGEAKAVMQYSGSTTNMVEDANNATTVGLNAEIFTVTSTKTNNNDTHIGLNKDGLIRIYGANKATLTVTSTIRITEIIVNSSKGALKVTVNDQTVSGTDGDNGVTYQINATSFVLSNTSTTTVDIKSVIIKYKELTNEEKALAALDIEKEHEANSFTVPASDETYGVNFTWSSSDESVATVSGNTVTVHKSGTVTLTATCGSETKDFTVTLTKPLTHAEKVTEALKAIEIDDTYECTTFSLPTHDDTYDLDISWTSSDTSVVTIDNETGTATIAEGVELEEITLTASIACDCGDLTHHTRAFEEIYVSWSEGHTHKWSESYTSDGASGHHQTCSGCDELNTEGHNYDNDTDTTCNKCDYVRTIGGNENKSVTETLTFSDDTKTTNRDSHSTAEEVWSLKEDDKTLITFTHTKGSKVGNTTNAGTNIADYAPLRIYGKNTIKIEANQMTKITITSAAGNDYRDSLNSSLTELAKDTNISYTQDTTNNNIFVITFTSACDSITFVNMATKQIRIESITIEFTPAA